MSRQKCQVFIWKGGWYSRQARYIIRSASTPSSVILFPCIQSAVTTLCGGYHKGGVELVLPILFSHLPLQWLSLLVFWEFPSYAVYSLRGILSSETIQYSPSGRQTSSWLYWTQLLNNPSFSTYIISYHQLFVKTILYLFSFSWSLLLLHTTNYRTSVIPTLNEFSSFPQRLRE